MTKVTCRGADITEHVAAMFDALVGSLDWGSGFLDAETIESVLIVAELAGFDVPQAAGGDPPGDKTHLSPKSRAKAIADWRAQIRAKARAMATEEP